MRLPHCKWHNNYCGHSCEECVHTLEAKVKFQAEMLERAKAHMTLAGPSHSEDEHEWLTDLERGEK